MTSPCVPAPAVSDDGKSLDPEDWSGLRRLGHRMLDDMFDHVAVNIVCFRCRTGPYDLDRFNADIVADPREDGIAAPSTTRFGGVLAIRSAIVNHRTDCSDTEALVDAILAAAARCTKAFRRVKCLTAV
jgi:hypothetical protein